MYEWYFASNSRITPSKFTLLKSRDHKKRVGASLTTSSYMPWQRFLHLCALSSILNLLKFSQDSKLSLVRQADVSTFVFSQLARSWRYLAVIETKPVWNKFVMQADTVTLDNLRHSLIKFIRTKNILTTIYNSYNTIRNTTRSLMIW